MKTPSQRPSNSLGTSEVGDYHLPLSGSPYGSIGVDRSAVTSRVPTNNAATQVDTRRNISDVMTAFLVEEASRPRNRTYAAGP